MIRGLVLAMLGLAGLLGIVDWSGQRDQVRRFQSALAREFQPPAPLPAARWAQALLGTAPPADPSSLTDRLAAWRLDPPVLGGVELLGEGEQGSAARVLLDAWLAIAPGAGGRAHSLAVRRGQEAAAPFELELEIGGVPAAVLGWTRELLVQPRLGGVLADPRLLQVRAESGELRARLVVTAWPAATLLADGEG